MINDWHDLFVATGGSAAALTGLIFVGVSLNLTRILSFAKLPNRALLSLLLLANILIVSLLCLIPQPLFLLGIEVLLTGASVYVTALVLDLGIYRNTHIDYKKKYALNFVLNQCSLLPYVISGTVILCCGEKGIYWMLPGIILSYLKALFDSWVLLVEINR